MKQQAPSTARNLGPIGDVLAQELPQKGLVLEIASGTGEHAANYARRFPALQWQPTDADPDALPSITAWRDESGLSNLLAPQLLDASAGEWPVARCDAIVAVNMVHISPVEATIGLFAGARRTLNPGGALILYGPYLEEGVTPAPSNLAFDASLRNRDSRWGLRHVEWMDDRAEDHGFVRSNRREMPANNLMLVYRHK